MELSTITFLLNRIILRQDGVDSIEGFYTVLEDDPQNPVVDQYDLIQWDHETMVKPTQAELDAELALYEEEQLELETHPLINTLLKRIEPTIEYYPVYNRGEKYSQAKWQDEFINEQNQVERDQLQADIDDLTSEKQTQDNRIAELEAIAEADRTTEEQEELDQLIISSADLATLIQETEDQKAAITDVGPGPRPTWDAVKQELQVYKDELEAARLQRLQEEEEYKEVDINLTIAELLGNEATYNKRGKHWDDVEIRSGHAKPTWSEVMTKWNEIKNNQQQFQTRENKKKDGENVEFICLSVLRLVAGNNLQKALTISQIDQMEIDFADIFKALKNHRPDKAKVLIEQVTPDGTLVTQEDKDEYLAELASFGVV